MIIIGFGQGTSPLFSFTYGASNETLARNIRKKTNKFVLSFLFSGINTITSFYFTSIGRAKESAVISASRGLVILMVCIFTLPVLFGMTGVWLVSPITEVITILITLYFIRRDD